MSGVATYEIIRSSMISFEIRGCKEWAERMGGGDFWILAISAFFNEGNLHCITTHWRACKWNIQPLILSLCWREPSWMLRPRGGKSILFLWYSKLHTNHTLADVIFIQLSLAINQSIPPPHNMSYSVYSSSFHKVWDKVHLWSWSDQQAFGNWSCQRFHWLVIHNWRQLDKIFWKTDNYKKK